MGKGLFVNQGSPCMELYGLAFEELVVTQRSDELVTTGEILTFFSCFSSQNYAEA